MIKHSHFRLNLNDSSAWEALTSRLDDGHCIVWSDYSNFGHDFILAVEVPRP
jgi:hypothetical protein